MRAESMSPRQMKGEYSRCTCYCGSPLRNAQRKAEVNHVTGGARVTLIVGLLFTLFGFWSATILITTTLMLCVLWWNCVGLGSLMTYIDLEHVIWCQSVSVRVWSKVCGFFGLGARSDISCLHSHAPEPPPSSGSLTHMCLTTVLSRCRGYTFSNPRRGQHVRYHLTWNKVKQRGRCQWAFNVTQTAN